MGDRGFVLVTGASRGLGRSLVFKLAECGFSVFAGVRRFADGDDLQHSASGDIRPLLLDVTKAEDLAVAETVVRRATAGSRFIGLVNNAATYLLGPFEQTPTTDVERLFQVNVFGLVAVTQHFLPLLRQAPGRIINISSLNGKLSVPFTSFYSASKFAVEALSDALRVELSPWNIHVSVVEPGVTRTDIRARGIKGWADSRGSLGPADLDLYAVPYAHLRDLIASADQSAAAHQHVLEAVEHALTADSPKTRYLAGPDMPHWMAMAALEDRERDAAFSRYSVSQLR